MLRRRLGTGVQVEEALRRQSCTEALQWCSDNRARLRKTSSTLEFQLRVQEYVELVRAGRLPDAMSHLRRHLAPFMDTHATDVQRVRRWVERACE
jgi:macrophage erythroblast attacher